MHQSQNFITMEMGPRSYGHHVGEHAQVLTDQLEWSKFQSDVILHKSKILEISINDFIWYLIKIGGYYDDFCPNWLGNNKCTFNDRLSKWNECIAVLIKIYVFQQNTIYWSRRRRRRRINEKFGKPLSNAKITSKRCCWNKLHELFSCELL